MTSYDRTPADGRLVLRRTGPFVPPITFPGLSDIVVTDPCRRSLESAPLGLVGFKPVHLERVVRLDWQAWDQEAAEPKLYPAGGEPEAYILGRKHDPEVAQSIGTLWELDMPEIPGLQLENLRVNGALYGGEPVVRARRGGCVYVSAQARDWLAEHLAEWVSFRDAAVQSGESRPR
jgi:hypothetical protein